MSTAVDRWAQPTLPVPPAGRDVVDGWAHQVAAVAKLATYIAATDFVPKGYRGQDAAVAAAILAGREIGIGPMTALQHLHVIDGRPAMSAQLMRALVFAHGHRIRVVESTSARCTLAGQRGGDPAEALVTWTTEDARRAGITGKTNWAHYPRQMLLARATGELCRVLFPDVIGGMAYTVEEADDIPAEIEAQAPPASRTVSRARAPKAAPPPPPPSSSAAAPSESPRSDTPAPSGAAPPPVGVAAPHGLGPSLPRHEIPELPSRRPTRAPQSPEEPEAAPEEPPAPSQAHKPLTGEQRNNLFRLLGELGKIEPRAERIRTVSGLVGRRLDSMSDLTRGEASGLIDTLVRATENPEILDPLITQGWERLNAHTPDPDAFPEPEHYALWEEPDEPATD